MTTPNWKEIDHKLSQERINFARPKKLLACPCCRCTDIVVVPDEENPLEQIATCDDCEYEWVIPT
jgi:hypothetical protein